MRKKKMRIVSSAMTFCMVSSLALSHVSLAQGTEGTVPVNTETTIEGEAQPGTEGQVEDTPVTNEDQTVAGGEQEDTVDKEETTDTTEEEKGTETDKEQTDAEDKQPTEDVEKENPEEDTEAVEKPVTPPADESATLESKASEDAALTDTWENAAGVDATINAVEEEWLHLKSKTGNINEESSCYFVSKEAKPFRNGYFEATIKAADEPKNTRTGVALRFNKVEGKNRPTCVFVGYDNLGWFWQVYSDNGKYYTGTRVPALKTGEEATLRVEVSGDTMNAFLNGEKLFAEDVDISSVPDAGGVAIKAAHYQDVSTDIYVKDVHYTLQADVTGRVVDQNGNPVADATVTVGGMSINTNEDGTFKTYLPIKDGYTLMVNKEDYDTYESKPFNVKDKNEVKLEDIVLNQQIQDVVTISSEQMDVTVDKNFPRVVKYTMKEGDIAGKTFLGQKQILETVTINGVDVKPEVKSVKEDNKITYEMTLKDDANDIDATLTAEIVVEKNTLAFNITKIDDRKIVKTIEIKNHNLLSVNSSQPGAVLDGANMQTNTQKSGDRKVIIDESLDVSAEAKQGYMYAFLSNNELSAGLWSNSENKVTADWQRVTATATQSKNGVKTMGLSSTYWTYQKDKEYRKEDGTIEYKDSSKGSPINIAELPSMKVAIAGDLNEDGDIDWNDGAIAYRDIMNNPNGSETIPDLVAYRIAMNFSSQAQNPFLMTLDNVKKVSLNTDGLGQSILLKGYGSEGHDSGHLNYADIGMRIGGAEDMKTLLEKGKLYGATFGIHVNASETYPESKYFSEDILMKEGNSYDYGWNWLDQGININADYDLRNGRVDRWKDLYDVLGGEKNNLDFIYVDVWGNGQSGDNGTWASRQLAKEITGLGWRLAGEWGHANEYDSTFQHWAADLTYGGCTSKGINSKIARFIRNHQKDSWVGNYPRYGGEAMAPLLFGYNMKDFEGWQGRSDYAAYISALFEVNVVSKFIQHFTVSDWEDGDAVTMTTVIDPQTGKIGTYNWTPGMSARLDGELGSLEIRRKTNKYTDDPNTYDYIQWPQYNTANDGFRTRTITLNGNKIYEGREGDIVPYEHQKDENTVITYFREGDVSYLIPWIWDNNGNVMPEDKQKLYHWKTTGGKSTWTLPAGWDVNSIKVYKLSDLGKEEVTGIIKDNGRGSITITAEAKTPYVIYQTEVKNNLEDMKWSEGMGIVDSGFNSGSLKPWTIEGATEGNGVAIKKSQGSNPMLMFSNTENKVSVSQSLTDLKPNTKYALYVGVDNRSDAEAELKVEAKDDDIKVVISREAGEGATYFDDIRVVENKSDNWEQWETEGIFQQDFENVAQGIYPFVVGEIEGVTDNRTHLAELHAPYTQKGWNGKIVNDVIGGKWSVKTNGLAQYNNLVYQTIPQNFKFEAGKSYVISFDYEAGSDNTYAFVTGDGEYDRDKLDTKIGLKSTLGSDPNAKSGHFVYNFVAPKDSDLGWIGIFSTTQAPDTKGLGRYSDQATFNGYSDFMLDNLVIIESSAVKTELLKAIETAKSKNPELHTKDSWNKVAEALEKAEKIVASGKSEQKDVDAITKELNQAIKDLEDVIATKELLQGIVERCKEYEKNEEKVEYYKKEVWLEFNIYLEFAERAIKDENASQEWIQTAYLDLIDKEIELRNNEMGVKTSQDSNIKGVETGSYQPGGGEAENATDGDKETLWHSNWNGNDLKDQWFEFEFEEPQMVNGFKQLPRSNGGNGLITKYKIEIQLDGSKDYITVKEGKWEYPGNDFTVYKEESFKEYKNVKKVKLVVLEGRGGFASAAELEVLGKTKGKQDVPSGLVGINVSEGNDGKITGVTDKMEWSKSVTGEYTSCEGTEITGLTAGSYYIRMKSTEEFSASIPVRVDIFDKTTKPVKASRKTIAGQPTPAPALSEVAETQEVTIKGKLSTTTGRSIAENYIGAYAHNKREEVATIDNTSYFQNMYVFFETGSVVPTPPTEDPTPTTEPTPTTDPTPTVPPVVVPTGSPVEPTASPSTSGDPSPTGQPTPQPTAKPDNVVVEEDETTKTETTTNVKKEEDKTVTETTTKVTDKNTGAVTETVVKKEETKAGTVAVDVTRKDGDTTIVANVEVNDKKEIVSSNAKVTPSKTETTTNGDKAEVKVGVADSVMKEVADALAKQSGADLSGTALNVEVVIPKTDVIKQINSNTVDTVVVAVSTPKETSAYKVTDIILPASVIEAAKDSNKNLKAEIKNNADEFLATWSFKQNILSNAETAITDINLALEVSKVSDVEKAEAIKEIVGKDKNNTEAKSIFLSFANEKDLPTAATINIAVAKNSNAKAGDKLYLYAINKETKKLEAVPNNAYKVSKAGNVAVNVIKGTDYVLLAKKPSLTVGVPLVNQTEVTLDGKSAGNATISGTGKQMSLEVELPITMKQVTKFSKKLANKAVTEAKVTYKSNNSKVVSVASDGTITSKKAGKATVTTTITLKEGKKKTVKTVITVK